MSFDIVIPNEIGPLGVHVVPCDTDGRLIVQGIEPGGRIDRDGRLAVSDCIVAINGYPLQVHSYRVSHIEMVIFKSEKIIFWKNLILFSRKLNYFFYLLVYSIHTWAA